MKKVAILICAILLLSGCAGGHQDVITKEKSVQVSVVTTSENPIEMNYLGTVEPYEIKKYAFMTGGILETLTVDIGDAVTADELLASLKLNKLNIAVDTAQEQSRAAQLAYAKAKESFNYYDKLLADTKALLDAGATSQQTYDEVKLKRDIAYKELSQVAASAEQARLQTNYNQDNADDAFLRGDMAGTILDVLYKVGEVVPQGYPVVVVRSQLNAIHVGMTAEDVKKVKVDDEAILTLANGNELSAKVMRINYVPDEGSRTYNVELTLADDGQLLLGESVDVRFKLAAIKGIWLPITSIKNDGQDYVYIIRDNRAKRVDIQVVNIYQDMVRVEGLTDGDQLIVSGTSALADGYLVKIIVPSTTEPTSETGSDTSTESDTEPTTETTSQLPSDTDAESTTQSGENNE